jgi:chorismate mutase
MKLPNSQKDFEDIMKNVDFTRVLQITVPILQPIIIGGLWLAFARFNKKADAVSKFIAIAESIPTIDLNLPKPVVLASLYHSIDEALDMLKEVIQTLKDIEIPTAEDIIDEAKEQILDPILDPIRENEQLQALAACNANAKKNLGFAYYTPAAGLWIVSCMAQKGFSVSLKYVKEKLGI